MIEFVENMSYGLSVHTAACIRNADLDFIAFRFKRNTDFSFFCVFESIGNEVCPYKFNKFGVRSDKNIFFYVCFHFQHFVFPNIFIGKNYFTKLFAQTESLSVRINILILKFVQFQYVCNET